MQTAITAQSQPTDVDGWTAHGITTARQGHFTQAIACFEQAVNLQPGNPILLCNLGTALMQAAQSVQALAVLEQVVQLAPEHAPAWFLLGNACMAQKAWTTAQAHYTQSLNLQPHVADTLRNRAVAQLQCHDLDAARTDCLAALELDPQHEATWRNLGLIERERGALAASLDAYDRALALNPHSAEAHTDRAHTLLLAGDFARGWDGYAWRWKKPLFALPQTLRQLPVWTGQDLQGRTLLLHSEQGLGDTLQFVRYVPDVHARGCRVVLAVQPSLVALLTQNLKDTVTVCAIDALIPSSDLRCALLDLPRLLNATTEPFAHATGYLRSLDPTTRQPEVKGSALQRLHVGLVWRGASRHPNDHRRSLSKAQLMAHLPEGMNYVSLQVEAGSPDWCETANQVAALDLILTVDTSVAHLAGAMGKPTWVLLPFAPDWRWQLHRTDSPWYHSLRLFRQPAPGDWDTPLRAAGSALAQWRSLHD